MELLTAAALEGMYSGSISKTTELMRAEIDKHSLTFRAVLWTSLYLGANSLVPSVLFMVLNPPQNGRETVLKKCNLFM